MSDGTPGDGYGDLTPRDVKLRVCGAMMWPLESYDYLECHCRRGSAHPDVIARWKVAEVRARRGVVELA